jgi:hypothetical protein
MRFTKILLVNGDGIVGSTFCEVPREHGFEWIFRIVESDEEFVAAMGILLDSYTSAIAGKPVCERIERRKELPWHR